MYILTRRMFTDKCCVLDVIEVMFVLGENKVYL